MEPVAALLIGYLLGSIPFGIVLTRLTGAGDLRQIGSGNIGATNVLRTGRKGAAAAPPPRAAAPPPPPPPAPAAAPPPPPPPPPPSPPPPPPPPPSPPPPRGCSAAV